MPDLTTVTDMPPWTINYSNRRNNAVVRTEYRGYRQQADYSHRKVDIASVTRRLFGAELPYFESFIRNQCNDGQLAFTDKYKDGNGVQSGTIRIVDGSYTVSTNGKNSNWIVSCEIEIFR